MATNKQKSFSSSVHYENPSRLPLLCLGHIYLTLYVRRHRRAFPFREMPHWWGAVSAVVTKVQHQTRSKVTFRTKYTRAETNGLRTQSFPIEIRAEQIVRISYWYQTAFSCFIIQVSVCSPLQYSFDKITLKVLLHIFKGKSVCSVIWPYCLNIHLCYRNMIIDNNYFNKCNWRVSM